MSLEGSLETIALPEVLHLLSDTSKSGELLVSGDRGEGRLWFDAGRLNGFDVHRCSEAADALFELLRAASGRFSFDAGGAPPESANAVGEEGSGEDIRPVLDVAQARMEEWTDIVAVVPSLEHHATLSPEAPREHIKMSAAQWSLVVMIGEGRTVGSVLERADLSEFEGCRSLKTLVEAGLVAVSEPPVAEESPVVEELPAAEELAMAREFPVADELSMLEELALAEAPEMPAAEPAMLSDLEAGESAESPSNVVEEDISHMTNGGSFDGHDFVFKAMPQPVDDDYEPQPVPYPEPHANGNGSHGLYDVEAGEVSEDGSMNPRAALEALLAEIPPDDSGNSSEFDGDRHEDHDGLADRGPWTSQELASFDQMGGWNDDQAAAGGEGHEYDFSGVDGQMAEETASSDLHFDAEDGDDSGDSASEFEAEDVDGSEEEAADSQPEPVNRGLLLKFLSSVRS